MEAVLKCTRMEKESQDSSNHMFLSALGLIGTASDTQSNREKTANAPAISAQTENINAKDLAERTNIFDWKHLSALYQTLATEVVDVISSGKLKLGTSTSYERRHLKRFCTSDIA